MEWRNQMLLQSRTRHLKALMPIGMLCLAVAIMWPNFIHPSSQAGKNWMEGLRGMLFGISIALNLGWVWLANRQRHCRQG
jgi:hypothetical protein